MLNTRFLKSEAVVISRYNHGEGDRLLKLFSYDYGKITLLAKGVRKTNSKKRGSIEVFSKLKFSAYKKSGIGVLTETYLSNAYLDLRKSVKKVALSYFLLEVIDKLTQSEETNVEVYDLLVRTLTDIQNRHDLKNIKNEFSSEILVILGFWPKGKKLDNPEYVIQSVIDKRLSSIRIGKSLIS